MAIARAHLVDLSRDPLVSLHDALRPPRVPARRRASSTARNGSSVGCKNLRKSSRWRSVGFR